MHKACEEIKEFIAGINAPEAVAAFRPPASAQARVSDLLAREKAEGLDAEEKSELDYYAQPEHLMRLAKARARQSLVEQSRP